MHYEAKGSNLKNDLENFGRDRIKLEVSFSNPSLTIIAPIIDWREYLENSRQEFFKRYYYKNDQQMSSNDFYFIKTLGVGAFGKVMLCQLKHNAQYCATKIINKQFVVGMKHVKQTQNEKNILNAIRFPFTVHLKYFFHDNVYLYFVMPLVEGGELFFHLRRQGKFDEHLSRFYAAQVILALEYLHYLDILYRDLKPENILLDGHGYLKLTDFGFGKRVIDRTYTLCGTPEYMAPEILLFKGYGKSVDYWSFGILVYELNSGITPFYALDQVRISEKIIEGRFRNPPYFSIELKEIVKHLLEPDITKRVGNFKRGIEDIKEHKWFKKITWLALLNKAIKAPYVPTLEGATNSMFFETYEEVLLSKNSVDPNESLFTDF